LLIRVFLFAATGVILWRAVLEVTDSLENYFRVLRGQVRVGIVSKFELFRTGLQNILIVGSAIIFTLIGFHLFLSNLPPTLLEDYGFFFFAFFGFMILLAVGMIWGGYHNLYLKTLQENGWERRRQIPTYTPHYPERRKVVDLGPLFSR